MDYKVYLHKKITDNLTFDDVLKERLGNNYNKAIEKIKHMTLIQFYDFFETIIEGED